MTRLETAMNAYNNTLKCSGSIHASILLTKAMQAALDAADAYNLAEYTKIHITEQPRPLAQSFVAHFREHWRNGHNGCFSADLADMSNAIGVALEKAFEEGERK